MHSGKNKAGTVFHSVSAENLAGETMEIGKPAAGADWKMVVVYRGWHCPLCTKYLNNLETHKQGLLDSGVDLIAISADTKSQLAGFMEKLEVSFPICYGLTIAQMQELGLYISTPRSEKETDHPFPEPGVFVINEKGQVQIAEISNNPFVRPELETLASGIAWIKNPENDYPIRGTYK